MSNNTKKTADRDEYRIVARVDGKTHKRVQDAASMTQLSGSDLLRMSLMTFLPQLESGKINIANLKKAA